MGDVLKPLPPLPQAMKGGGHPGIEGELGSSSSREGNNKIPLPPLVITSSILNIALFLCCVSVAFFRRRHRRRRSQYLPPEERDLIGEPFPAVTLPAGLHASVLRLIPIYTYRVNNIKGEEEEGGGGGGGGGEEEKEGTGAVGVNSECAVCLREFRHGNTLRILPACGHSFHLGCIDQWLGAHTTCPLCRSQITSSSKPNVEDEGQSPNGGDDGDNNNNRNDGNTDTNTDTYNYNNNYSNNYDNNEAVSAVSEGTSSGDGGREIIAKMGGNLHRSLSDGEIWMHARHNHVIIITIDHLAMQSSSIGQNRSSSLDLERALPS